MWFSLPFTKRRQAPQELDRLLTVDELRTLLDRERSRVDRRGGQFAMLRFTPREAGPSQATLVELVRILNGRLRSTDDAGWLGDQQLGVVLPDTTPAGARHVAGEVCQSFGQLAPPHCEIYCYPASAISDGHHGNGHQRSGQNGNGSQNGSSHGRPAEGNGQSQHDGEISAGAMEPLFVHPLSLATRLLDIVGAIGALIAFSPIMITAAVAVKLTSRGPIFFKQSRAGRGSQPFLMYKFRTMQVGVHTLQEQLRELNESDGPAFKIKNDPRITSIGSFLRRSSIDELPQFWNVLKGDMSLVGPRPLPCDESAACAAWQKERLRVKPGLTCIWQVKGRSKVTSFDQWMRMDLNYVQDRSFIKDLKILAATVPAVVMGKGAY